MSTTGRYSNVTLSPEALAAAAAARAERARRRAEERRRREEARRRARFAAAVEACTGGQAPALERIDEIERGASAWTGGTLSPESRRRLDAARAQISAIAGNAHQLDAGTFDVTAAEGLARAMAEATGQIERLSHSLTGGGPETGDGPVRGRAVEAAELRAQLAAAPDPGDTAWQEAIAQVSRLEGFAARDDQGAFDRMVDVVAEQVSAATATGAHRAREWAEQRHRAAVAVAQVSDETEALARECAEVGHRPSALDALVAVEQALADDLAANDLEAVARDLADVRARYEQVTTELDEWLDLEEQRTTIEAAVARAVQAAGLRVEPETRTVPIDGGPPSRVIVAHLRDDTEAFFSVVTDEHGDHQVVCSAEGLPDDRGRPVETIAACRDLDASLQRVVAVAAGRADVGLSSWQLATASGPDHGGAVRQPRRRSTAPNRVHTHPTTPATGGPR